MALVLQFSVRRCLVKALAAICAALVAAWPHATTLAYNPGATWPGSVQNYAYANFGGLNGVGWPDAEAQIDQAASTWSNAVSPWRLQESTGSYSIGIDDCFFPTNTCVIGQPPNLSAITHVYAQNGLISSVAMHFNTGWDPNTGYTTLTWTTACPEPPGTTDVQTVALHEFGHTLDLGDLYSGGYYNSPDSIIGWNTGSGCKHTLGQDDLDGLHAMYGVRQYVSGVTYNSSGWNSTLTIGTDTGAANVRITFYGGTGYSPSTVYQTSPFQVSFGNPANFRVPTFLGGLGAPAGVYGATVDSDQRTVFVVHKAFNNGNTLAEGTGQVAPWGEQPAESAQTVPRVPSVGTCPSATQTQTYVPLIMNNNHGWSTQLAIQNLGPSACSGSDPVSITYYDSNGNPTGGAQYGLGEDRTIVVGQAGTSAPPVGSAVLTSADNLAVTVEELKSPLVSALFYKGFSTNGASTIDYLPLVQNNNRGWTSGIQVQNTGSKPTTVTLSINGSGWTSPAINPNASYTIFPPLIGGFTVGSGYVQSNNYQNNGPQNLAVVVNQITSTGNQGSTYSAFSASAGYVFLSSLANGYSDPDSWTTWTSGLQIENADSAANCYALWINGQWQDYVQLNLYQSYTWFPIPGVGSGSQIATEIGGCGGAKSVAVVNNIGPDNSGNDAFYTYDGSLK